MMKVGPRGWDHRPSELSWHHPALMEEQATRPNKLAQSCDVRRQTHSNTFLLFFFQGPGVVNAAPLNLPACHIVLLAVRRIEKLRFWWKAEKKHGRAACSNIRRSRRGGQMGRTNYSQEEERASREFLTGVHLGSLICDISAHCNCHNRHEMDKLAWIFVFF